MKNNACKKDNIIWMFIGGVFGVLLGAFAFYDGWFE